MKTIAKKDKLLIAVCAGIIGISLGMVGSQLITNYNNSKKIGWIEMPVQKEKVMFQTSTFNKAQQVIDDHPENATTVNGVQDNYDNLSTMIIGHEYGVFQNIKKLKVEDVIKVDDGKTKRDYKVKEILFGNENYDLEDGKNILNEVEEKGNKERLILQTCVDSDEEFKQRTWVICEPK